MTQFLSGQVLLQTARMLREGLDPEDGVLVVEGASDQKLFRRLCRSPQQILVAGGKSLLTDAHEAMRRGDRGAIVFVVDCDGDVPSGVLQGASDLIISTNNDAEADLIALGVLKPVLAELLPAGIVGSEASLNEVTHSVQERVVELTLPVARVRHAARELGMSLRELKPWEINYGEVSDRDPAGRTERALACVVRSAKLTPSQAKRLAHVVRHDGGDARMCNGHDLVLASEFVLRHDYGLAARRVGALDSMVRMAVDLPACRGWKVLERLRRWEARFGRRVLQAE